MIPEELQSIATSVPVIAVMLWWISDLKTQLREIREQRDRWINDYILHMKEIDLKKSNDEQTELK